MGLRHRLSGRNELKQVVVSGIGCETGRHSHPDVSLLEGLFILESACAIPLTPPSPQGEGAPSTASNWRNRLVSTTAGGKKQSGVAAALCPRTP
jgi:hypothetical protein